MPNQTVFRLANRTSIEGLTVHTEPIPQPAQQEVLIKVRSVALNFRDYAIATGKYPFAVKDNPVPCSDLAGEVESVGGQVGDFKKGDRVVASFDLATQYGPIKNWDNGLGGPRDGTLREYISLPSNVLVKVPETSELSFAQLSSVVCTGTTAWNALYGNMPLKPGQTVLFLGTGGVSITGLMLAKAAGAKTIITSSSDEKLAHVQKTYGADHLINYNTTPNWSDEVMKITGGLGADFILENGGAGTIGQSLACVAFGGIIAVIGFLAHCSQEDMANVAVGVLTRNANVRGVVIGSKQQLEDVTKFVTEKNLKLPVEKEFGFSREEVVAAYKLMESGKHVGKICIKVA